MSPHLARRLALAALALVFVGLSVGVAPAPTAASGVPGFGGSDVASLGRWTWPVAGAREVVRAWAAPPTPYAAGHRGVDLGAQRVGAAVLAPAAGTVHFAGTVVDRPLVSIDHGAGILSSMEPVEPVVHRGDTVAAGQVIGMLGAGHCARACVHLGVRLDGQYVSPLLLLGGVPLPVLLPTRGIP